MKHMGTKSQKPLNRIRGNNWLDRIIIGDSKNIIKRISDSSIDLIITSPPYADQRKSSYGGINPNDYVKWFLPISKEFHRVLKPTGSFVLNIKERVVDGERHPYVLELILALRKQGWLWTEEYIWHKKNSFPGKWPNRFRDSWERCLHFTKEKKFLMYQETVMVPMGAWKNDRVKNPSKADSQRPSSGVGNPLTRKVSNWFDRQLAYPTNVLNLPTECTNRGHSAAFPVELPSWFIRLFTKPGDIVLDAFIGSGTTAVAARSLDRHYVGIELHEEYAIAACERIAKVEMSVLSGMRDTKSLSTVPIASQYKLVSEAPLTHLIPAIHS